MKTGTRAALVGVTLVVFIMITGSLLVLAWKEKALTNLQTGQAANTPSRVPRKESVGGTANDLEPPIITEEWLSKSCSRCHRVPPPDAFPRSAWKAALSHMLTTAGVAAPETIGIPVDAVTKWYKDRAPEQLPMAQMTLDEGSTELEVKHHEFAVRGFNMFLPAARSRAREQSALAKAPIPGVSNVRFFDLVDDARLELIV